MECLEQAGGKACFGCARIKIRCVEIGGGQQEPVDERPKKKARVSMATRPAPTPAPTPAPRAPHPKPKKKRSTAKSQLPAASSLPEQGLTIKSRPPATRIQPAPATTSQRAPATIIQPAPALKSRPPPKTVKAVDEDDRRRTFAELSKGAGE